MKDTQLKSANKTECRQALEAIVQSRTFEDVHRLRSFLEYVAAATLENSRKKIRAKLIAADVYRRSSDEIGDPEAIVRVDAGRLRRRLELYYATEGASDPVIISIPKGGYTAAFHLRLGDETEQSATQEAERTTKYFASNNLALLFVIGCIAFFGGWLANGFSQSEQVRLEPAVESATFNPDAEIRLSINQVSSASLLARTFVEEAQILTFPTIDPARPRAAEILCRRAIEMAPDLAVGHSCDAYVQAFFAFLLPPGLERDTRLANARKEVDLALRIDPAASYSLMASAWTQFVEGDRGAAIEKAATAVQLGADQPFLRNFYGMMMTFEGRGSDLLSSGLADFPNTPADDLYHPFILAGAKLQEQDYEGVIKAVERAVALEGRTSRLITTMQISALENTGASAEAEALAQNLYDTWSVQDIRSQLQKFFSKDSDADAIAGPVEDVFFRVGLQINPKN